MKIRSVQSINPWQSVIQTKWKAHGGTLKVESEDGKGSAFIIQIPIKPTKDENN